MIRGTEDNTISLITWIIKIDYVHNYFYLGAWITDDAKMNTVITLHETVNKTLLNKFAIFCAANSNMLFTYKRKVFDAAVTSALFYDAETWLVNYLKKLIAQYNRAVKCLLSVRKHTSPELCFIESDIQPVFYWIWYSVQETIAKRIWKFLESKLRTPYKEEPFPIVYELCREANTAGSESLAQTLRYQCSINPLDESKRRLRAKPPLST